MESLPRLSLVPLAILILLVGTYLFGVIASPPRWEEPRAALVAYEMIERGDYVVPHLLGEPRPYEPPMHSWLVVLSALGDKDRIGPLTLRVPTLFALVAVAVLLWRLGVRDGGGAHPLPPLVFATLGVVVQYGRAGEADLPFAFFVWAAWAAFEAGRRRGSPYLQWTVPQVLLAGALLTRAVAPLFFYPPALWLAWRRRDIVRFRAAPFLAGLGALLLVVAAWLVPHAIRVPESIPAARQAAAVGALDVLRHLARSPFEAFGAALPWSLVLPALLLPRVRDHARGLLADPYCAIVATFLAWGLLAYLLVPSAQPRHLIPALPAAAVLAAAVLDRLRPRSVPPGLIVGVTAAVVVLWIAGLLIVGRRALAGLSPVDAWSLIGALLAFGAAAVGAGATVVSQGRPLLGALVVAALLYALFHAGVGEPRGAARDVIAARSGEALASAVPDGRPVVCGADLDRRVAWAFTRSLGRVPGRRVPAGPYLFLAAVAEAPPGGGLLAESEGFALWAVSP